MASSWFDTTWFFNLTFHGQAILVLAVLFIPSGLHLLIRLPKHKRHYSLVCFVGALYNFTDFLGNYPNSCSILLLASIYFGLRVYMVFAREFKIQWPRVHEISYREESISEIIISSALVFGILAAPEIAEVDSDFTICVACSLLNVIAGIWLSPIFFPFAIQFVICAFLYYYLLMPEKHPQYLGNFAMLTTGFVHVIIVNCLPYVFSNHGDTSNFMLEEPLGAGALISLDAVSEDTPSEASLETIESVRLETYACLDSGNTTSEGSSVPTNVPALEILPDIIPKNLVRKKTLQALMSLYGTEGLEYDSQA